MQEKHIEGLTPADSLWVENGITQVKELFVDKIRTKQLCIKEDGEEVCINKNQLKELLERTNSPVNQSNETSSSTPQSETPTDESANQTSIESSLTEQPSVQESPTGQPSVADSTSTPGNTDGISGN